MLLPKARGALSDVLFEAMRAWPGSELAVEVAPDGPEDAAIALWAAYELHHAGFDDADDGLEWHPGLLAVRARLERDLERRLRERYAGSGPAPFAGTDLPERLLALIDGHDGPSLARHVQVAADRDQVLDLLRLRSVYHQKEADPTAWAVPRLGTRPKAALVELLYDEYGAGDPARLHSHLWTLGMEASGLRADYGAYVDDAPLEVLEQNNAMSLFGLHRRLRGAALGHLAAFEATSSVPSRRMAQGLARLGFPEELVGYYTEHVEADAVHEQLAVRSICGSLVDDEPALADDVLLGAFTCLDLEARVARRVLGEWGVAA
jgi:hypothetical protein